MNLQRISVIIPAYNAARYLAEAVMSVLDQNLPSNEVIIIDDGSTDETALVAQTFGAQIRYQKIAHAGNGAARNWGVQLATGELLAFLDADDRWLPGKLEAQFAALEHDEQLEAVFTQIRQFISPDLDITQSAQLQIKPEISRAPHVGTLLIRRAALARIGPFATTQHRAVFIDWYARAQEQGLRHTVLDQVLMHRRLHLDNLGRREREHQSDYLYTARAILARRRQVASE